MNTALVSVIVATYRREAALRNAINSLIQQSYQNIEIVVVDDNAHEEWNKKVSDILSEFSIQNNITYIVNETNQGSAKSRNTGIFAAKVQYITFLDDDDVYLQEKVEAQLEDMIRTNADYGITDLALYSMNDKLIEKRVRSYIQSSDLRMLMRYHLMHHMTGTDTFMFKADYLKKIGGFPLIDIGDEFYLMKEAILASGKFVYSNQCYLKAYVHVGENGGLSSGQAKIDGENRLHEEKRKYYNYLSKKDVRYVEMRHYAVITFAELRRKNYVSAVKNGVISFYKSPVGLFNLIKGMK